MRIASAISVQRVGPSPIRPASWRVLHAHAIAEISAAPTLPPPNRGDAAWLTLLMAQTMAGPRRPDAPSAQRVYGAPRAEAPIFALVA